VGSAGYGFGAKFGGMGKTGRFARHGAQAKALGDIVGGAFQAAIIKGEALALGLFEVKLAVIHALKGVVGDLGGFIGVKAGGAVKKRVSAGNICHLSLLSSGVKRDRNNAG
jgi:hypothetical protein